MTLLYTVTTCLCLGKSIQKFIERAFLIIILNRHQCSKKNMFMFYFNTKKCRSIISCCMSSGTVSTSASNGFKNYWISSLFNKHIIVGLTFIEHSAHSIYLPSLCGILLFSNCNHLSWKVIIFRVDGLHMMGSRATSSQCATVWRSGHS